MNTINFNENYNNKLDCRFFTTIRKKTPKHMEKYMGGLKEEWSILLKGKEYCTARIVDIRTFPSLYAIHFLPLLELDTGRNRGEAISLFERYGIDRLNDEVIVLTFRRGEG